jgi:hypothetical protein
MSACERCDTYLQQRRPTLLPHVGRWVVRSGKPPRNITDALAGHFHKRGHRQ